MINETILKKYHQYLECENNKLDFFINANSGLRCKFRCKSDSEIQRGGGEKVHCF